MPTQTKAKDHERWLAELTAIPTAAGREQRVIAWVARWVKARKDLVLERDQSGNLIITPRGSKAARNRKRGIWFTAHLDHPAFVVTPGSLGDREIELEFRGGVHDPYFPGAAIDIIDAKDRPHRAKIIELDATAKPFKRVVARLSEKNGTIAPGDIGRWVFSTGPQAVMRKGQLHAPACDDLAAVAAALAAIDIITSNKGGASGSVGVLLTRAEEVGFVGAIAACKLKSIPKGTRLICLENSRSYAESPIGAGPIVRVGDKASVFTPELTNRISHIAADYQAKHQDFKWQRKLMPGGTCEATAFATFGYESTCLCLPLGNYHNMVAIDDVLSGRARAKCDAEYISIDDYHGLIELLVVTAANLDSADASPLKARLNKLHKDRASLLQ
jgi:putative aminopeptidase FrvX